MSQVVSGLAGGPDGACEQLLNPAHAAPPRPARCAHDPADADDPAAPAVCAVGDGASFATAGPDGWLRVWSGRARRLAHQTRLPAGPAGGRYGTCLDWTPADGGRLCAGLSDGAAAVFACAGPAHRPALLALLAPPGPAADGPVRCVRYAPGGGLLALARAGRLEVRPAGGPAPGEWERLRGGAVGRGARVVGVDWAEDGRMLRAAVDRPARDVLFWAVDLGPGPGPGPEGRVRAVQAGAARGVAWAGVECGTVWEAAGLYPDGGDGEAQVAVVHSAGLDTRAAGAAGRVEVVVAGRRDGALDAGTAPCRSAAGLRRFATPHQGGVGALRLLAGTGAGRLALVTTGACDRTIAQWRVTVAQERTDPGGAAE